MAASWFCEKSGWIGKVEDVKPVFLIFKKERNSTGNHFEEEDFCMDELWNRRYSSGLIHLLVLGLMLYVCCRLIALWRMANKQSFCFIIAFHNCATLENRLTYRCPSSRPVVITMKKKLAGTWKKKRKGYWPVQINGNKFAPGQILRKPVEVVKGRTLAVELKSLPNHVWDPKSWHKKVGS
jgi:hypothetical protein